MLKSIIKEVAVKMGRNPADILKLYRRYWYYIRVSISDKYLKDISEKELDEMKTNVSLPELGRLVTSWELIQNSIERTEKIKEIIERNETNKNKTAVYHSCDYRKQI